MSSDAHPQHDGTPGAQSTPRPADAGPQESLSSAARALADATAALTRLLGQQMGAVSDDVGHAVAVGLREASRGLETASESIGTAGRVQDKRRERAEATRTELLDAAARVIARRGYGGASVGDVAGEAGFTKGAVYSTFGSKDELMRALVAREVGSGRVVPPAGPAAADAQQALVTLEALAYLARDGAARQELAGALDRALGAQDDPAALDAALVRLAVAAVGPLVEEALPRTAGATARVLGEHHAG